jgi:Beta-lactamase
MKDTFFYPLEGNPRLVTLYRKTVNGLEREQNPSRWNGVYFDGGGGLMSTAEDYFKFAQMLLNDGELQGTRLLAPRTVEIMRSLSCRRLCPAASRARIWPERSRHHQSAGPQYVSLGGQFRLEWWVRYTLLGRSEGACHRHPDGTDRHHSGPSGPRDRGDAGHRRAGTPVMCRQLLMVINLFRRSLAHSTSSELPSLLSTFNAYSPNTKGRA